MKIVYLIDYNPQENSGVIQKIKAQAKQWVNYGHEIYFVSISTMSVYDRDCSVVYKHKKLKMNFGRVGTANKLLYSYYHLKKLLAKIEFDVIYMRYQLYMPFFIKSLKEHRVIMEINSDDSIEYKLHSKVTHFYNKFTRDFILKNVDAFVSVSDELKNRFLYLGKPIKVIANGIDGSLYTIKEDKYNSKPILVFIGTPNQPWHGLDKILKLADRFKQYDFYIIGTDGNDRDNIRYFGYKTNEEATEIIRECDVGIGTLSLYKAGLHEASPLKTRQYLACGLPLLYAYADTDVPTDASFALKLENKENNLEYEKIEAFMKRVFNNKELSVQARAFAEENLGYSVKEKSRLAFFQKVLDEK